MYGSRITETEALRSLLSSRARLRLNANQNYIFNCWLDFLGLSIRPLKGDVSGFVCTVHDGYKIRFTSITDYVISIADKIDVIDLYSEVNKAYVSPDFTEMQACALLMHMKTDARIFLVISKASY